MKRGKPLKRSTGLKRTGFTKRRATPLQRSTGAHSARSGATRAPLPAESARRKRERKARVAVRAEVLARDGGCVARRYGLGGACWGPLDVNELVRRGRWAAGYLVADNCVTLCRRHHEWVTVHIEQARALGLDLPAPPVHPPPWCR